MFCYKRICWEPNTHTNTTLADIRYITVHVTVRDIYSNFKNPKIISIPGILASDARVGLGRARDTFSNHIPKPDTACDIPILLVVCPASAGFSGYLALFFCWAVSPPRRSFEAATCSFASARRLIWGPACCPQSVCEVESDIYALKVVFECSVGLRGLSTECFYQEHLL